MRLEPLGPLCRAFKALVSAVSPLNQSDTITCPATTHLNKPSRQNLRLTYDRQDNTSGTTHTQKKLGSRLRACLNDRESLSSRMRYTVTLSKVIILFTHATIPATAVAVATYFNRHVDTYSRRSYGGVGGESVRV